MPGEKPKPNKPRRRIKILALLVVAAAVFWFGHPPVLSWALRRGIGMLCEARGLEFQAGRVETRIGRPFVIEDAKLRAAKGQTKAIEAELLATCEAAGAVKLSTSESIIARRVPSAGVAA